MFYLLDIYDSIYFVKDLPWLDVISDIVKNNEFQIMWIKVAHYTLK